MIRKSMFWKYTFIALHIVCEFISTKKAVNDFSMTCQIARIEIDLLTYTNCEAKNIILQILYPNI